jgi:hypothetical protein
MTGHKLTGNVFGLVAEIQCDIMNLLYHAHIVFSNTVVFDFFTSGWKF